MKRREFIAFLACSAVSSLAARAEQGALPVIGVRFGSTTL